MSQILKEMAEQWLCAYHWLDAGCSFPLDSRLFCIYAFVTLSFLKRNASSGHVSASHTRCRISPANVVPFARLFNNDIRDQYRNRHLCRVSTLHIKRIWRCKFVCVCVCALSPSHDEWHRWHCRMCDRTSMSHFIEIAVEIKCSPHTTDWCKRKWKSNSKQFHPKNIVEIRLSIYVWQINQHQQSCQALVSFRPILPNKNVFSKGVGEKNREIEYVNMSICQMNTEDGAIRLSSLRCVAVAIIHGCNGGNMRRVFINGNDNHCLTNRAIGKIKWNVAIMQCIQNKFQCDFGFWLVAERWTASLRLKKTFFFCLLKIRFRQKFYCPRNHCPIKM